MNGYGRVPHTKYLYYYKDKKREGVLREKLIEYIIFDDVEPKDALSRVRFIDNWNKKSAYKKKKTLNNLSKAAKKPVYCITKRLRFDSIEDAREYFDIRLRRFAEYIKDERKIKGLRFRFIDKKIKKNEKIYTKQ